VFAASLAFASSLAASPGVDPRAEPAERVLIVGTMVAPPFVARAPDGRWTGRSVELWREIAEDGQLRFEFQERDLDGLLRGLEDGSLDVVAAPVPMTADSEARVDLTHPFFTTDLAIALSRTRTESWVDTLAMIFNPALLGLLVVFAGLQLLAGALMWLLERRGNPHFQGSPLAGVGAGMWWAVVTMSTVGYGDKVPHSGAGRLLAMTWMLVSLIMLTTFTAAITSSLTLDRLEAKVSGPEDLGKLRVGSIAASTSEAYLRDARLNFRRYPDADTGLAAVARGEVDALVYDEPVLAGLIAERHDEQVVLLPRTFQRQDYAFAVPTGSPLREPINRILARRVADPQDP
jgi:polar amino acid transport system substrate-binding protein